MPENPASSSAPPPSAHPDLLLAREAIVNARQTLHLVRRRKLPANDARIVHDLLGPGSERARAYALLPELAPWREDFEQAAMQMDAEREAARGLFGKSSRP